VELRYDEQGELLDIEAADAQGKLLRPVITVVSVLKGTIAEFVGLKPGDILERYDGGTISSMQHFLAVRRTELASDPLRELKVKRDGKSMTLSLYPGQLGAFLNQRFQPATPR
jgi:S1-C subfamily serine protease